MGSFCSSFEKKFEEICLITSYFNPTRNKRRLELHLDFVKRLSIYSGLQIITVECAFQNHAFELFPQKHSKETIIQIKADNILWLKENLINIAIKKLFNNKKFVENCKYVVWSDDDIEFVDETWMNKFRNSLEKYKIVQMFKEALFLDINEKILQKHTSFGYYYSEKRLKLNDDEYPHPGYIWGTKTSNLMKIGQLFDYGVLGNGDIHMAYALIGEYLKSFPNKITLNENYRNCLKKWQDKALQIFEKNVGYTDIVIKHHWHGSKKNRQHLYRWLLLSKFNYDPLELIVKSDGHYEINELKNKNSEFIKKVKEYFIDRREDDNTCDEKNEDLYVPYEDKRFKLKNFKTNISKFAQKKKQINKINDKQVT